MIAVTRTIKVKIRVIITGNKIHNLAGKPSKCLSKRKFEESRPALCRRKITMSAKMKQLQFYKNVNLNILDRYDH